MSSKDPIFPIPGQQQQQQHFNDYGFDSQIDYLQSIWGEAKRSSSSSSSRQSSKPKPLDSFRFKLQKPIYKEGKTKKRSKWWKKALQLLRWRRGKDDQRPHCKDQEANGRGLGPLYMTESCGARGPSCRRRPASGLVPYVNLRELNAMDVERRPVSPMPIYLVT